MKTSKWIRIACCSVIDCKLFYVRFWPQKYERRVNFYGYFGDKRLLADSGKNKQTMESECNADRPKSHLTEIILGRRGQGFEPDNSRLSTVLKQGAPQHHHQDNTCRAVLTSSSVPRNPSPSSNTQRKKIKSRTAPVANFGPAGRFDTLTRKGRRHSTTSTRIPKRHENRTSTG